MFIEFQKISTSNPLNKSPIIINAEALISMDFGNFENNGILHDVTNIEVIGNPKYRFYTMASSASIQSHLNISDITNGFVPVTPGTIVLFPAVTNPLLKMRELFNNTILEFKERIINPAHILYAENIIINDAGTQSQQTVLMIIMGDTLRTKIMTTLSYSDLLLILQPIQIP